MDLGGKKDAFLAWFAMGGTDRQCRWVGAVREETGEKNGYHQAVEIHGRQCGKIGPQDEAPDVERLTVQKVNLVLP